jgi:ADP-heptose:LPS heptosyltransferase
MPYNYSKKKVFFTKIVEFLAFLLLFFHKLFREKLNANSDVKKILLIEPFQMGDVLSLTPMIEYLLSGFPKSEIYVLTKPSSGAILELDQRIKKVFVTDFIWSDYGSKKPDLKRIFALYKYLKYLRNEKFDIGIDTRGDIRSQIILMYLQCKQIIGYRNYLHSNITLRGLLLDKSLKTSTYRHRYLWNLELLKLLDIRDFTLRLPCFFPKKFSTFFHKDFVLVHIGGGWEFKRWQEEKWIELIKHLQEANFKVTVIGGTAEKDIIERIQRFFTSSEQISFETTSLVRLVELAASCNFMIALDSGPMNLAVCLGKKVIALFGPGDSEMWQPLSEGSVFTHKKNLFSCNPCLQIFCKYPEKNCMASIDVEEVISLMK